MKTIIDPNQPLPIDLLDILHNAGFDEADIIIMMEDLRQAQCHLATESQNL